MSFVVPLFRCAIPISLCDFVLPRASRHRASDFYGVSLYYCFTCPLFEFFLRCRHASKICLSCQSSIIIRGPGTYEEIWAARPDKPPPCPPQLRDCLRKHARSADSLSFKSLPSSAIIVWLLLHHLQVKCGASGRAVLSLPVGGSSDVNIAWIKVNQRSSTLPVTFSAKLSSSITFGLLNIRSLAAKIDDLLEVRRDRSIDDLAVIESWHDAELVALRRLHVEDFTVIDHPRLATLIARI